MPPSPSLPLGRSGARRGPRRRLAATLALLSTLTAGLTGCVEEPTGPVDDRVQLSVFWWGAERRAELTEQALNLYTERHPNVTFRVTWQGNTGYYDRLSTEAASGNAPDMFQIDDNYLTEYAERGITLDLSEYVNDNRLNLNELPTSLAQYGQVGGKTMGVAAAANTPGMVYNKSLLQRLDLPEPQIGMTYDEFIDWAATVTERTKGEVAGTMDPSADYKALWMWLRSEGKELYQGRQLGFTAEDLTRWFDLWKNARISKATPAPAIVAQANSGDVTRQLVVTGQAATSFMWSNQLPELQKQTDDELDVVSYPGRPEAQWARASMYWSAFRGTRDPAVVVDVIDFLTNDIEAGRILGTERGLSANLGVRRVVQASLTDEGMKRSTAFEAGMTDRFGAAPVPPPKGHARVRALLLAAAEDAQLGRSPTRQAATRFISEANAALVAE